ncbi:hypothetical protein RB195_003424 [Necator americanus]|uniref:Endonuclease/exonuclease/phosphatase domain-containing protein n=1 Tax=Necator americanus TaxID=51031 RepID=A0ABR1DNJ1_NECAM
MTICTYNASTLASEAEIKDLMAQAKKIKYDVIKLTETRRRQNLDYAFADVIHDKNFCVQKTVIPDYLIGAVQPTQHSNRHKKETSTRYNCTFAPPSARDERRTAIE